MELVTIARIRSGFTQKFGIPRQSGLVEDLAARVEFEEDYRSADAVRALEDFSHIWLVWGFSEAVREGWQPTVRPPRLGGNARMGVFATRSPYRPNALGLSSVRLERIEQSARLGPVLHVRGADLLDGTPIYDIKPYLPYTDCHPDASGGFAHELPARLRVVVDDPRFFALDEELRALITELLSCDPRPPYHDDPARVYGMAYAGYNVRFTVDGDELRVCELAART